MVDQEPEKPPEATPPAGEAPAVRLVCVTPVSPTPDRHPLAAMNYGSAPQGSAAERLKVYLDGPTVFCA